MSDQPPEGYAELDKAAEIAKVSTKTIRNWAKARRIGQRKLPGSAKKVYNVEDIRKELAKSAEMTIAQNPAGPPMLAGMGSSIAAAVADQIGSRLPGADASHVPIAEKLRVTIKEAMALGFTRINLLEMVDAGVLENVGTPNKYRFRRRDLDAL